MRMFDDLHSLCGSHHLMISIQMCGPNCLMISIHLW